MIKDLGHGLYFIAKEESFDHIHCNSYLIVENDEAVLVEPGSVLDFDVVLEEIKSVIDPKKITYVLLSHPDADLASSMPNFEKVLGDFSIITEWRSKEILEFYGLKRPYYQVREHNFTLTLSKNRTLYFYMTPFAHYAGAFVTYDTLSKTLLSGDLFGGYAKDWDLYANEDYVESMAMYHENYMPSSDFIRPIMKELLKMDIERICPQHGRIIPTDLVKESINFLYKHDFYNASTTVERVVKTNRKYDYQNILTQMVIRLLNLYDEDDVKDLFANTKIQVSFSPVEVTSSLKGYNLWNIFFDIIHKKKGDEWLNTLETLVNKITSIYHIKKPEAYLNRYKDFASKQKQQAFERNLLEAELTSLEHAYKQTIEESSKCPITGLPKQEILMNFLLDKDTSKSGLLFIELDQIEEINRTYDKSVGDNQIKTLAYTIENEKQEDEYLFRSKGSGIIVYCDDIEEDELNARATTFRNVIADSANFIEDVTAGIGVVPLNEEMTASKDQVKEAILQGSLRVELAHQKGHSKIISTKTSHQDLYDFKALLVDEDEINVNMITKYFQAENIELLHAKNPLEAIEMIESQSINAIISEINLSKLDGFSLKQKLNKTTQYASIPFFFVSHQKTHQLINRANELGVDFFLQKPFYPNELIGLVKRLAR